MGGASQAAEEMGEVSPQEMALFKAKLADQAERYEDIIDSMADIIKMGLPGDDLKPEERNHISVGYKNVMSTRRAAWRIVEQYLEAAVNKGVDPSLTTPYAAYKKMLENEIDCVIEKVVDEVVNVFTKGPQASQKAENLVFFKKMEGDYYRYGAETADPVTDGERHTKYKNKAKEAYEAAQKHGAELEPTNPIFLGLGLNQSVYYYEICGSEEDKKFATQLASEHFDNALNGLDQLDEANYKDATLIMQLLKDNLTLWEGPKDPQNENGDDDVEIEEM